MKKAYFAMALSIIFLLAASCCSQKTATVTEENTKTNVDDVVVINNDYTTGVITKTKEEGECQWVIKLKDGRIFETTDMKENFMKDGTVVYFKYRGLRRMSSCPGASPIEITEMNTNM